MPTIDEYIPEFSERGRRWLRFLGVLVAAGLLTWLALFLREVLTPLVAAMALAYMLNPIVTWLELNRQISRVTSVTSGLIILLLIAAGLLAGGTLQIIQLSENIPTYAAQTTDWIERSFPALLSAGVEAPAQSAPDEMEITSPNNTEDGTEDQQVLIADDEAAQPAAGNRDDLARLVKQHWMSIGQAVLGYVTRLVSNVFAWISFAVLLPIYTFFLLLNFNQIVTAVRDHLPAAYRPLIVSMVSTIDNAITHFFRGQLVICLLVGSLTGVGWLCVGVPYSLALGALAGLLNLIPFMSVLALPPALLLTYVHATDAGTNWLLAVSLTMAVYMIVQALESFLFTPTIQSKASGLHPITTVVSLMIGGQVAGLLGMLLAIPIASTLKSLGAEYLLPEVRRLARDGESPADASAQPATDGTSPQPPQEKE